MKKNLFKVALRYASLFILVVLSACSGLAGEVAIVATLTPIPTSASMPEDNGYAKAPPNLVRGAEIYAQNCTACHGINGAGDGELVQSGQVGQMASFLDIAHVRTKRPDEYYEIITNGNLEKLMPPWQEALTTQERWDVALYAYTLHYTPENITLGKKLYESSCLECHGITGKGDGEKQLLIGGEAYDLTYYNDMNYIGDSAVVEVIQYGKGEAMPAQDGILTSDEMWAIVQYVRSFSTTREQTNLEPATTEESAAPSIEGTVTITGSVTNGTSGATIPPNMTVYLRYGSSPEDIQDVSTVVQMDGTFSFTDIPLIPEYGYVVSAIYQNISFISEIKETAALQQDSRLPLIIYEPTDDPFVISVKDIYTQIEPFPEIEDSTIGQGLLVTQKITYFNNSDRVFQLQQNNMTFSLLIQVPPSAVILDPRQNPRFLVSQENYAIIDQNPMYPNDNVVDINYFLPYEEGAVFDQTFNYPINGTAQIVTSPKSIQIIDSLWTRDDTAPFINQYSRTYNETNNGSLKFELNGKVNALTSDNPSLITANVLVPVLAIVVIILCVGVLVYSQWMKRRKNPDIEIQLLLRQLAELDMLHDKGQINHDAYQRQRQSLKTRLTTLMASQSSKGNSP